MRVACPSCSATRKKQKSKDCVVTDKPDGTQVYYCHHCGDSGVFRQAKDLSPSTQFKHSTPLHVVPNQQEEKMVSPQKMELDSEHIQYLESRGISSSTATESGVFGAEKWFARLNKKCKSIAFPYKQNGEILSVKYRSLEGKDFTQDSSGQSLLYNIDNIDKTQPLIFVEGEIDALTLLECGITNCVSVPTGAPIKVSEGRVDPSEDRRFQYIWQSHDVIKECPNIIIATDNDTAGKALAEELARRIGKDKCHLVDFGDYKDFNEVLLTEGKEKVQAMVDNSKPYPVEGLLAPIDFEERLNNLRTNGTGRDGTPGLPS